MAIKIGTISISLTAETSSFQQDMGKASQIAMNSSKNIERSFTIMGTAITAAVGSAVGALGMLIDKTQDVVFNMQKMAQQAGISMESFSKLAYNAKIAGMPMDQMAVMLTRVAHSSLLASYGSLEQAAAYKALGISVTNANGTFKTADQLMLELARTLDQYKDSAAKTGVETIIMGRSGAQAAEYLHVLATSFEKNSQEAEKLGVIFDDKTAAAAQTLHDNLINLEEAGLGLSVRLLSQVSPALDEIVGKIADFVSSTEGKNEINEFGKDLAIAVRDLGKVFDYLITHTTQVKHVLEGLLAIRAAGFFAPMISSAASTSDFFGKLSVAALNVTGNLLGIRKMGATIGPLAKGAKDYTSAIGSLAKEEGVASTAAYAIGDGFKAATAGAAGFISAVGPLAGVAAVLLDIYELIKATHDYGQLLKEDGETWTDAWKAGIDQITGSLQNLKDFMSAIVKGDFASAFTDMDIALAKKAHHEVYDKNYSGGYDSDTGHHDDAPIGTSPKKDFKGIGQEYGDGGLQKKLGELIIKAQEAQNALALIGATPEEQNKAKIAEKLNQFLIDQKKNLDKLSQSQQEQIKTAAKQAITDEVLFEWAAKYSQELTDLNNQLEQSIQSHLAMAAAVGKSAKAMQDATVDAKVNAQMQKAFGKDWMYNPQAISDAAKIRDKIRAEMNDANLVNDATNLDSMKAQLNAQLRMNDAIAKGAEARRQAQIIADQEAARRDFIARGDTNQAALQKVLDGIRQMSDAKDEAADVERAMSMSSAERYRQERQDIEDATLAAKRHGVALDYREVLAADKEAWMAFQEAQDKAILATGNAVDGLRVALNQMARDTESDAQLMHDAFLHAVDSINDSLSRSLLAHAYTGHEYRRNILNGLSGTVRGIGSDVMNTAMKKGESAILKGFGFGGKPDGSSQNPWYVKVINGVATGAKDISHLFTGSAAGTSSGIHSGGTFSEIVGTLFNFLPKFADGGDVIPGMPSIVGERGPELFVPPSAGAIVPNNRLGSLGGDTHHWHIDATGAHDPAQTVMLIHQYMKHVAPNIAAGAVHLTKDSALRIPASRR